MVVFTVQALRSLPVLFRGICQSVGADSELVVKFLDAPSSAYSHNPSANVSSLSIGAGKDISLVTAMQARNNARVTVVGSLDLLSNALFKVSRIFMGTFNTVKGTFNMF
jgi:oligosaccharyltransferase complex subunit beta